MSRRSRVVNVRALASRAARSFVIRRDLLLASFAGDQRSAGSVLVVLENLHEHLYRDFERRGGDANTWQVYGPCDDLTELRAAVAGSCSFSDLVDRARRHAGGSP